MVKLQRGFEFAKGYRLQEFLGKGQFGEVWRAAAPGGTKCALKFIDLTDDQGTKEYQAIERIKQIQHANLMTITAIWLLNEQGQVIDDAPEPDLTTLGEDELASIGQSGMVVMPQDEPATLVVGMLLGGKSLYGLLRERQREGKSGIPPRELLSYMQDSAKGLDFLNEPRHDLGNGLVSIQHCDVKPANIVVYGNAAVVCDFGLARILSRNQATMDAAVGTPHYMAPEAIAGQPSQTSDQYSLAVTYYHLRTGTLPIADTTLIQILDAHRQGKLSFDDVPPAEQEVLRKATHLDWQQRFDSNIEFVEHLRDAVRGVTPVSVAPKPPVHDNSQRDRGEDSTTGDDLDSTVAPVVPLPDKKPLQDSTGRLSKRVLAGVGGTTVAAAMLYFIAGRFNGDDTPIVDSGNKGTHHAGENKQPRPLDQWDFDELLSEANAKMDSNPPRAAAAFGEALSRRPSLAVPSAVQTVQSNGSAVESLLLTADSDAVISTAYSPEPQVWPIQRSDGQQPLGNPVPLQGLDANIASESVALSSSRDRLVAGAGRKAAIWALAAGNGKPDRVENLDGIVTSLTVHPAHELGWIAGIDGDSPGIQILDPATPEKNIRIYGSDVPNRVWVAPDGDWLFARGLDEGRLVAYAWPDVLNSQGGNRDPTEIPVTAAGSQARCLAVAESHDSSATQLIVGDDDGSLTYYLISEGSANAVQRIQPHQSSVEAICVRRLSSDKGHLVVSSASDGTIAESYANQSLVASWERQLSGKEVACVDVTASGRWIAAGDFDGYWWLIDRTAEQSRAAKIPVDPDVSIPVMSIRINEPAGLVLVGCEDGAIRVWDLRRCQLIAISHDIIDQQIEISIDQENSPI